jgi:hypothetical protein
MIAPKVEKSMSPDQAKEHLQEAIGELTAIYNIIGTFPMSSIAHSLPLKDLLKRFEIGQQLLERLAADENPF